MTKTQTKLLVAVLALAGMTQAFATGPVFHPEFTETGKNLSHWHTLGQADWKAENGELVGTPGTNGAGGWLVFNKSYQDILLYTQLRCSDGCTTGLLTRAEKTPDGGMKGVYLSITDTSNGMRAGGTYDATLDAQGKIVSATEEPRGSGFDRIITPWPPKPRPAPAPRPAPPAGAQGGAQGGPGGGGRRGPGAQLPFARNETPSGPEDWKTVQVHYDANTFRGGVSGGGGRGGGISLTAEGYGPIAFYVGGTGKVELKDFAISDLALRVRAPEITGADFKKQTLNDFYYGWGQDAADFNHDGHLDIASGPYIYYGPDFTHYREYFRGEATDPTNDFAMDAHDVFARTFTGHANWPDIITVKFGGGPCVYLYVNSQNENRIWDKYDVVDNVQSELSTVADIEGPGKPALVYSGEQYVRYAEPDPANPTGKWIVHNVSERGYGAGHGIGAGDINGDGRLDILNGNGWWENPGPGNDPNTPWKYHSVPFSEAGGAVMEVFDVNGDGLPDVVTSLAAHGWGLAWFEQKRDAQGNISFVKHMVMDDFSDRKPGDVMPYTELHGSGVGDVNGDGIPDFITGKRWYSHLDSGIDPDTEGQPVLYWYETVRDPKAEGGARLVPHLINNRSGVGNFVLATDLNPKPGMSETDIVTSTRFGAFIFWGKPHPKKAVHANAAAHPTTQTKHTPGE